MTDVQPWGAWHWAWSSFIACAGVALAGTATPSSRRIWSIGLRVTKTACPASGFVPVKLADRRTLSWAREALDVPEIPAPASAASMGAGADDGAGAAESGVAVGETGAAERIGTRAVSPTAGETAAGAEYDAGKDGIGPVAG